MDGLGSTCLVISTFTKQPFDRLIVFAQTELKRQVRFLAARPSSPPSSHEETRGKINELSQVDETRGDGQKGGKRRQSRQRGRGGRRGARRGEYSRVNGERRDAGERKDRRILRLSLERGTMACGRMLRSCGARVQDLAIQRVRHKRRRVEWGERPGHQANTELRPLPLSFPCHLQPLTVRVILAVLCAAC